MNSIMLDAMNIASLVLGVISLILTLVYGRRAKTLHKSLFNHFEHRTMDVLVAALEKGALKDANQVRGIVENVSIEFNVAALSDQYIVILLRRIALKYQQRGTFTQRTQNLLDHLESIRRELEPRGLPLASIASVNSVTAFQIVVYVMVISLLFVLTHNVLSVGPRWITLIVICIELLLATLMIGIHNRMKRSFSMHIK